MSQKSNTSSKQHNESESHLEAIDSRVSSRASSFEENSKNSHNEPSSSHSSTNIHAEAGPSRKKGGFKKALKLLFSEHRDYEDTRSSEQYSSQSMNNQPGVYHTSPTDPDVLIETNTSADHSNANPPPYSESMNFSNANAEFSVERNNKPNHNDFGYYFDKYRRLQRRYRRRQRRLNMFIIASSMNGGMC